MSINPFLEERLIVDAVVLGSTYVDEYNVEITETRGDQEYRRLINPFPKRRFKMDFTVDLVDLYPDILNLYHKCFCKYKGFRVRCLDDFSTNAATGVPTALDQPLVRVGAGQFQLRKVYASSGGERTIFKPVSGTVKVSIVGVDKTAFSTVDLTTGIVTFTSGPSANILYNVSAITNAASAIVTVGTHAMVNGNAVYFSNVVGMTQMNGLTGTVIATTATTITVNINSTSFSTYVSGGHAEPTHAVNGGCEFDIPVRFDTTVEVGQDYHALRSLSGVELIELINP